MTPVLEINDLSFGYTSSDVVRSITTSFSPGEFAALVGPNGAGKSTLLKIMGGLIRTYRGSAKFFGEEISRVAPRDLARRLAFVPQDTQMVFPFTVAEIVFMGRLPHRPRTLFDSPGDARSAREAMALTDTAEFSQKRFNELSGGERQRVVLASALAQNPEVLLLDEPTAFLDLKHQLQFYEILERLNAERGLTIISVTHDVNLAARYAPRMIALRSGKFMADGTPEQVLTPQHLYDIFEITAAVLKRPDGRGNYIVPTA
ncbi:MAG TPA: ABC transporter ATP-binding protein [Terriglobia bacterium]|jgi:iron complex transport system ATP-binding protein